MSNLKRKLKFFRKKRDDAFRNMYLKQKYLRKKMIQSIFNKGNAFGTNVYFSKVGDNIFELELYIEDKDIKKNIDHHILKLYKVNKFYLKSMLHNELYLTQIKLENLEEYYVYKNKFLNLLNRDSVSISSMRDILLSNMVFLLSKNYKYIDYNYTEVLNYDYSHPIYKDFINTNILEINGIETFKKRFIRKDCNYYIVNLGFIEISSSEDIKNEINRLTKYKKECNIDNIDIEKINSGFQEIDKIIHEKIGLYTDIMTEKLFNKNFVIKDNIYYFFNKRNNNIFKAIENKLNLDFKTKANKNYIHVLNL